MQRYHPVLVALHWIMALMVLVALAAGSLVLDDMPNDDPDKTVALAAHMSAGMAMGVLLILRLAVRLLTRKPPPATTGSELLDRIGVWTHRAFYALIAGMVVSGLATAFGADLFAVVFLGAADTVPAGLSDLPQRAAHGWIAAALAALVVLHVAAAVYHHTVLKDGLLRRMWFGKRD